MKFDPPDTYGIKAAIRHWDTYENLIGDGKFPNKYWVTISNDFYIQQGNSLEWASEIYPFKTWTKTLKPFDTFKAARKYVKDIIDGRTKYTFSSYYPRKKNVNMISIEDRLSGVIYDFVVKAKVRGTNIPIEDAIYDVDIFENWDTKFTEKEMKKGGYEFE